MSNAPELQQPNLPDPADEVGHPPGPEALWNESWYFDFADLGAGLGGWVRLGLYPNKGRAWINALLCGPGLPTVALNDFTAAVPVDPAKVQADGFTLTQWAAERLQLYRVRFDGTAMAYDDPAALLRGEPGRPVRVEADLIWHTDGQPYRYTATSRYELPCEVSGAVAVDGVARTVGAAPGQRDHSWGVRDWWGVDWMWFALHLRDGTRLHGVQVRVPGLADTVGIGYAQRTGTPLIELTDIRADTDFGADGLPGRTRLRLAPGDLAGDVEVLAHAPVRLVADDGRVAQFPRAWVNVRLDDGRVGTGWMEWNRNL